MADFVNTLVAAEDEVYDELDIQPVKRPRIVNWNVNELALLAKQHHPDCDKDPDEAKKAQQWLLDFFKTNLNDAEQKNLKSAWHFWARHNQIAPEGDWTFWLLLAGRGFGKTRTGAEWVNERVESGKAKRIALVGPTAADVRKVMVEGESGILAISPPWNTPTWEPSKLQLTWPNGAIAQLFSAEEPERLRGPQCDTFWADELAAWKKMQETWDMLQFGFRLGLDPRGVVTTTPKPLPIVKELVADDRDLIEEQRKDDWAGQTALTKGSTYDNIANLTPKFFQQVVKKYEGTRLGRQELEAHILEDMPGALWVRDQLDANRIGGTPQFPAIIKPMDIITGKRDFENMATLQYVADLIMRAVPEDLVRISVNVDPNVSNNEGSDEIGITVTGKGMSGQGYCLADCSMKGTPDEWASTAIIAHDLFKADHVVYEANQGGNMVKYTIEQTAKSLRMDGKRKSDFIATIAVHATRGKVTRAEPVSLLYEQNRVSHIGSMPILEDQMCLFTSDFDRKAMGYSPDRVDSLVWGFTHLFLEDQGGTGLFEHMRRQVAEMNSGKSGQTAAALQLVKLSAPRLAGEVTGRQGDKYIIRDGFVHVAKEDMAPLLPHGFALVED